MGESRNQITVQFPALPENVALARQLAAWAAARLDLTLSALDELRVAVSEAVSNAIVHGYVSDPEGVVRVTLDASPQELWIEISDDGVGMADVEAAMRPQPNASGEHMGLGFSFMRAFMDELRVSSSPGLGTTVMLCKRAEKRKER